MTETNTVYAGLVGLTIVPSKSKNYGCDMLRNFDSTNRYIPTSA